MIVNEYKFPSLKYFGNVIEHVSPSTYEHLLNLHTSIKDLRYKDSMIEKVKSLTSFEEVCIETINRCNGSCSFCPVNKNSDTREYHLMTDKLFYSIIDQLHNINYDKAVSLHCNNEPLLDKRIYKFAEYTRNKLPNAYIVMNTNGTLLTPENFHKLIRNIDLLVIDNYNDNLKLNNNTIPINDICKNNEEYNKKVWITLRKQNEILNTRAGQAKNRKSIKTLSSPCIYPFMQISIRSDGKVSQCCNDSLGKETLGDTNYESLESIWNGHGFVNLRHNLLESRSLVSMCKHCDTNVIPLDVR